MRSIWTRKALQSRLQIADVKHCWGYVANNGGRREYLCRMFLGAPIEQLAASLRRVDIPLAYVGTECPHCEIMFTRMSIEHLINHVHCESY